MLPPETTGCVLECICTATSNGQLAPRSGEIAGFVQICDACHALQCNRSQIVLRGLPMMEPSKQQQLTETDMNKIFIALMVIFFLGDPGMETLAWLGDIRNYVVAAAVALVSTPFIISQLDG